jgi:predicted short-subunit dehydrogenase-like oxidoreductase (DUF2520 family)
MKNILLIGSGNIATHLALNIDKEKYHIVQVFGRSKENTELLANKINSDWTIDASKIEKADITIIAINDDSIKTILTSLPNNPTVHTSGSTNIDVFKGYFEDYGVLYPLQTFNKDVDLDLRTVTFFIEANNQKFQRDLNELSNSFSQNTQLLNSHKRKQLHIAAVFSCNFSNHMFVIAKNLVEKENINYSVLLPLIKQTLSKMENLNPQDTQTGPAIRNDNLIMQEHINSIKEDNLKEIYYLISQNIIQGNE